MGNGEVIATYAAPDDAPINEYNPNQVRGTAPAPNIKTLVKRVLVIHEAAIVSGQDYDSVKLMVSGDQIDGRIEVSSTSRFIKAAAEDLIARKLLPARVRVSSEGKALFFETP